MANGNGSTRLNDWATSGRSENSAEARASLHAHPAWLAFVRYCRELQHGEIECLKIQDGLPVLAEVTKKKVKFA